MLRREQIQTDEAWVQRITPYYMWYEYLAISPSYELARRVRADEAVDDAELPTDFEEVLRVYDDLGDVQNTLFLDWWDRVGLRQFGTLGLKPSVTRIGIRQDARRERRGEDVSDGLYHFDHYEWREQGKPENLLLAIPTGMSDGEIIEQIKQQLAMARAEQVHDDGYCDEIQPNYVVFGQRFQQATLASYYRVVLCSLAYKDEEQWRIGLRCNVASTYGEDMDPATSKPTATNSYDRDMITSATNRILRFARFLAENAARGRFPMKDDLPTALPFDMNDLVQRYQARLRRQRQARRMTGSRYSKLPNMETPDSFYVELPDMGIDFLESPT